MTFKEINTEHHFWQFVENVWVDSIFTPKDISNSTLNRTSTRTGNSVLYDNTILGAVTVRQLRVRNQTCVIPEDLRPYITDCYGRYSVENRDTNSYGPGNQWTWTNDDMLDGVMYWGLYDTYDGSGYVLSVPPTFQSAVDFFAELRQNKWIDRQTRAVFFDVTLFNANLNIFTVVRLLVEFTHAGGLTTSSSFYASTFPTLEREEDYTMRTLQLIFLGLYGFYVLQEVFKVAKHIKTQKTPFFPNYFLDNLWNILDWVNLLIFAASIAFYFYRWNYIHQLFDENKDLHLRVNYVQFWRYAWWSLNERNLSAVNIFLAWAKYFKFTIFIPKLQQLSKTLRLAIRDIFFFLLMFLIIFFGFTLAAYMLFGADLHEFSSVGITMFTLVSLKVFIENLATFLTNLITLPILVRNASRRIRIRKILDNEPRHGSIIFCLFYRALLFRSFEHVCRHHSRHVCHRKTRYRQPSRRLVPCCYQNRFYGFQKTTKLETKRDYSITRSF